MKRKIFEHVITGLGIGFVATTASLWLFRLDKASGDVVMQQFTTWLIASVMYSLISIIYDTNLPLPLSLSIHFAGCAAITFAASYFSGLLQFMAWYEWFIYVLPYFIAVYLVIGAVSTIVTRYQAKAINEKIKK